VNIISYTARCVLIFSTNLSKSISQSTRK
jgi:hypothetical protein